MKKRNGIRLSVRPTFGIVLGAVGGVVVLQDGVVVLQRALLLQVAVDAAAATAAGGRDDGGRFEAVVLAEELVVAQRVLVAGHQLLLARRALEALEVEDLVLGPHHIVALAKGPQTLVALGTKQPGKKEGKCTFDHDRDSLRSRKAVMIQIGNWYELVPQYVGKLTHLT